VFGLRYFLFFHILSKVLMRSSTGGCVEKIEESFSLKGSLIKRGATARVTFIGLSCLIFLRALMRPGG